MHFVYILESVGDPNHLYTGYSEDPQSRLTEHNQGKSPHTAEQAPWRLKNVFGFVERDNALAFERYLQSGSGRAFALRHF